MFAAAAASLLLAAQAVAAEPPQAIKVAETNDGVTLDNGLVSVRCTTLKNGIQQQYLAARGGQWVLVAEGFRPPAEFPPAAAQLYRSSIDPHHRFITTEVLRSVEISKDAQGTPRLVLRGAAGNTTIQQTIELRPGQPLVHIEAQATLPGSPPKLEYLLLPLTMAINGKPDVTHVSAYKPTADSVIGDRVFFAPAACVQKDGLFAALIPDLDIINRSVLQAKGARQHPDSNSFPVPVDPRQVSMPMALDLELQSGLTPRPILSYGMMDYAVHQHVWYQHSSAPGAMVRELSAGEVRIGMDLLLSADAPKFRGYQMAARHLWQRYGSEYFRRERPQVMPLAEYARVCYPASFAYKGYSVAGRSLAHRPASAPKSLETWQAWETGGQPVGGLRLSAPQWYHLVANLAWWNNACDATGMHYWGKQLGDAALQDKAQRAVNFGLSAPQTDGLFPAVYDLDKKRWMGSLWRPPQKGYDPNRRDCYWNWNTGVCQTAAASVTAGYLLQYRAGCQSDPRILPFVRSYGDFLVRHMQPGGCVPAWFDEGSPLPSLKWNADGGAHAWVLAELYRATNEPKYLEAARRAGRFLVEEVLPGQKWYDFEAFYSCAVKPETFFDARTGQPARCMMSAGWAIQGFLSLYEVTQDRTWLDAALAVADYTLFYQAVWAPHYIITAYPFGGFNSQLGDAEWLDQRSHRFAGPLVRLGLAAGRQDLIERGVAAARASLTLVNHPRNVENGVYRYPNFPLGLGPENIDHEGFPQMPLRSGASWCEVGGLAAAAHVLGQLGGATVDFQKNLAVGVDGLCVKDFRREGSLIRLKLESQLATLPAPYREAYPVELRIAGLPPGEYKLVINDGSPQTADAGLLARYRLMVAGDGNIRRDKDEHRTGPP